MTSWCRQRFPEIAPRLGSRRRRRAWSATKRLCLRRGGPHLLGDLLGGDREQNAEIIRAILGGEPGPKRDIVLMNASAALVAGGRARDLKEGVELAARSIDGGAARGKLERLIALSRELAQEK